MEQSSCVNLLCLGAQGLGFLFVAGVLYQYRALVYPHPAYLFQLHTTAAALFILLLVCTTSWSIRAQISPKQRADFLRWHKNGNLAIVGLSATTACFMLYKRWSEGMGLLLLVRAPSYHSWSSLVWVALELILVVTGLIIYIPANMATSQVL